MSVLQTIDLKKYYGTEPNITRALDGVNFSVEDGEFVAVVGTSGSGKSKLRKKLRFEPDLPNYIESVAGIGYKFEHL
ncbi:ATP-binding cassette domain-containing protein [Longibaculum muris]